jgi:hypothetical protein
MGAIQRDKEDNAPFLGQGRTQRKGREVNAQELKVKREKR